jgi:hypothetical protein
MAALLPFRAPIVVLEPKKNRLYCTSRTSRTAKYLRISRALPKEKPRSADENRTRWAESSREGTRTHQNPDADGGTCLSGPRADATGSARSPPMSPVRSGGGNGGLAGGESMER